MDFWSPTRRSLLTYVPAAVGLADLTDTVRAARTVDTSEGWPKFQYDNRRTGSSVLTDAPGPQLAESWSLNVGQEVRQIRIANGAVFANGYAVDADTGEGMWSGTIDAFHDGRIYAATDGDDYRDTVSQIDPETGDIEWSVTLDMAETESISRLLGDGESILVAVSKDGARTTGSVRSLSIETRSQQWVRDRVSVGSEFAAADGSVYFADYAGDLSLHCLDIADGSTNWNTETATVDIGTPTVRGNTVFLPNSDADLMAFGAELGTKKWEFNTPDDGFGSPAATDEYVVCGLGEGMFCLSHDMDINWEFQVDADWAPVGGAAIVDDTVYFGARDGNFYVLDLHSGEELSRFETGSEIVGPPAVAHDTVYFGTEDGTLYALTGQPNQPPQAAFSYSPQNPRVDTEVTFDAGESTDDRSIEEYSWQIGDTNHVPETGETISKVFETPGARAVELTVTDDQGASDTTSKRLEVVRDNQVPTAAISYSPTEPTVGETVTFDGTASSDPDGTIATYEWDIDQRSDSGYHVDGPTADYAFEQPGEKAVKLRVVDDDGLEAVAEETPTVVEERVRLDFAGVKTNVAPGEEAVLSLGIVNFLPNDDVTVQLLVEAPSEISVSGGADDDSGPGQYTAVETVPPASQSSIRVRLEAVEPGEFRIRGSAIWYAGDDDEDIEQYSDTVTVRAQSSGPTDGGDTEGPASGSGADDSSSLTAPGFGVLGALAGLGGGVALRTLRRTAREETTEE
ncbi:PKD domain-containing protein [Halobellus sp. GM3]|uniref:PKD domain-containing protein n=1 Tax=Halobellus sp. GM3 TaxID=3458410 RepID=UPI00403DA2CD